MYEPVALSEMPPIGQTYWINGAPSVPDGFHRFVYFDPVRQRLYFKRLPSAPSASSLGAPNAKRTPRGQRPRADRTLMLSSIVWHPLKQLELSQKAVRVEAIALNKRLAVPSKQPEKLTVRAQKNRVVLQALCHPELLHEVLVEDSKAEIQLLAKNHGLPLQQVKRLFYRLLDCGLDVTHAATTAHWRSGKRKNQDYAKKQGRTRKKVRNGIAARYTGVNADKHVREDIAAFVQSGYAHDKSIQHNYGQFKARYGIKQVHVLSNGTTVPETKPEEELITYRQFQYRSKEIQKALKDQLSVVQLKAITKRSFTVHVGSARSRIPNPGHSILIDSTVADVYLVTSWDRTRLIGRPVLYFVVDAMTSAVLGIHITLRTPTAREAKLALYSALSDKEAWLLQHNLGAYKAFFPTSPLPYEFLPDRAELLSESGREAAAALGINVGMPAAYTPQWKALVERMFKTINNTAIHWLPGNTGGRTRERGEPDVRLDAVLTLEEFTRLILYAVLRWNARGQTSLQLVPALLRENQDHDVGPAGYFNWGIDNLHGSPRYLTQDKLIVRLMEGLSCAVEAHGITLDNDNWGAPWMKDQSLTLSGLLTRPAVLYRDPHQAKNAFVKVDGEEILRPVNLLESQVEGTEFDLEEYKVLESAKRAIGLIKSQSLDTTLIHASNQIVAAAKAKTRIARGENPKTKAATVRGIDENRAEQIARIEQNQVSPVKPPKSHNDSFTSQLAGDDFLAALNELSGA